MINWIKRWLYNRKYYSKYGWYGQRWYETHDGRILWKYMWTAPVELTEKKEAMQWFFDKAGKEESYFRHYSQPDRLRKTKKSWTEKKQ